MKASRLEIGILETMNRWAIESQIHFCKLAKMVDVTFENVTYPTGMKCVIAKANGQTAEVGLKSAKMLRSQGYMIYG